MAQLVALMVVVVAVWTGDAKASGRAFHVQKRLALGNDVQSLDPWRRKILAPIYRAGGPVPFEV